MDWPEDPLRIDPGDALAEICALIESTAQSLNRRGAVLGLSGGLDSSLAAAVVVRALGPERTTLIHLPERDSKRIHRRHARLMAERLGCPLQVISITPILRRMGTYRLLPLSFFPTRALKRRAVAFGRKRLLSHTNGEFLSARLDASGGPWLARAHAYVSAKHRVRADILYREAERTSSLVVGAANRTEWMTGTFTQWGCDHCADVMPLLHLYRSQLQPLAAHLDLPHEIRTKRADPDVLPGLDDKDALLGGFASADQILWGLEHGYPVQLLARKFGVDRVAYLRQLVANAAVYREAPYSLR